MSRRIEFNDLNLKVDNDERVLFANFESSSISCIAYNMEDQSMYVVFTNSIEKRYVYINVPAKAFLALVAEPSVGAAFTKFRKAGYEYFDEPNKF